MNVFKLSANIKSLEAEKQHAFHVFYSDCMNKKLRPITMDFTLAIVGINSLVNLFGQYSIGSSWSSVHPLAYLYCFSIVFLALVNRFSEFRFKAPYMAYSLLFIMMAFTYRDFVIESGWLEPVMGLYFFLAFIGYVTASIKHTIILLLLNTTLLSMSFVLVYGGQDGFSKVAALLSSAFIFNCTLSALASAVFVNWIFKNLFASQFLLNEQKDALVATLKMLKTTEDQLIQQQKYQALNHMAKGLLHEIINPVNSSSQALSFAQSINTDENIGEAIDEAMSQQKRISDIVTDLRHFAQPEPNQKFEPSSLNSVITKAVKFCQRELKKNNVELNVHIGDQQYIACQPSALTQVFVNLIINASDALKHKAEELPRNIEIYSEETPEELLIVIKDNGVGMSEKMLQQIQDPFFSNNKSPDNMGLGLSICQTIMRHHQGSMQIRSVVNEWTEVELSLPSSIKVSQPAVAEKEKETLSHKSVPKRDLT